MIYFQYVFFYVSSYASALLSLLCMNASQPLIVCGPLPPALHPCTAHAVAILLGYQTVITSSKKVSSTR